MGVMNWGSTSCVLRFECWPGRQYALLKEINCWGAFPKCFLLCTYLSKYPFQLLLTCQSLFFIWFALVYACVHACVCVLLVVFSNRNTRRGWKTQPDVLTPTVLSFYRLTSKYIPIECLHVCWVSSSLDRHFRTSFSSVSIQPWKEETIIINHSVLNQLWIAK